MTGRRIPMTDVKPGDIASIASRLWSCLSGRFRSPPGSIKPIWEPTWEQCDEHGEPVPTKNPPRYWCSTSVLVIGKR